MSLVNLFFSEQFKKIINTFRYLCKQCRSSADPDIMWLCTVCHAVIDFLTQFLITKTHLFKYILKILPPKHENFLKKISDIFHILAQNIDCGYSLEPPRRGGSNEYPQSMFWAKKKRKIMYTPVNPSLRGSKLYRHVFVMYLQQ